MKTKITEPPLIQSRKFHAWETGALLTECIRRRSHLRKASVFSWLLLEVDVLRQGK